MLRLIVCMIGLSLFGVLYAEIFNGFDWIGFKLNPYGFGTIVAAVFLVSEMALKRLEERARRSNQNQVRCEKVRQIYYLGLSILGFILLVMVPFIWWGAIKKLAESANRGVY